MSKIHGRRVMMFRCYKDPMIGPMPRQAFMLKDLKMEGEITEHGVYVKCPIANGTGFSEHIVPFANVESIRLEPLSDVIDIKEAKKNKTQNGAV